ncbi:MAG TPA: patatin-like phospholipase family protein [Bauldia sp.]|nr:patatin-like phospholipase family protein [Bauldia sp.]
MNAPPRSLRIGVALGGGAAQGFAHVTVLEAIDELGLRPAAVAGTSMGAIIGAAYAAGMSGAEIRAYAINLFRRRSVFLARLWRLRPRKISEVSLGLGQFDLTKALRAFMPPVLPEDIAGLAVPFAAVATDFYAGTEVVIRNGPLIPALAASSAVPILFQPVVFDGRVMIDGGCVNPVPFDRVGDVDFVIASDVVSLPRGGPHRVPGPIQTAFGSVVLVLNTILQEKLRNTKPPGVMIRPPTGDFGPMDFTKAAAIIAASEPGKDQVKRQIAAALEGWVTSRG